MAEFDAQSTAAVIDAVKESLTKSTAEVQATAAELAELEEKKKSGRYSSTALKDEIFPAISAARSRLEDQKRGAEAAAKMITAEFRQKVEKAEQLNPAEITDDVKLLSLGIPLTESDLNAMLERNKNNRTMCKLIQRYAEQHDMNTAFQYVGGQIEQQTADNLDGIISAYMQWIDRPADAAAMLNKYFE